MIEWFSLRLRLACYLPDSPPPHLPSWLQFRCMADTCISRGAIPDRTQCRKSKAIEAYHAHVTPTCHSLLMHMCRAADSAEAIRAAAAGRGSGAHFGHQGHTSICAPGCAVWNRCIGDNAPSGSLPGSSQTAALRPLLLLCSDTRPSCQVDGRTGVYWEASSSTVDVCATCSSHAVIPSGQWHA